MPESISLRPAVHGSLIHGGDASGSYQFVQPGDYRLSAEDNHEGYWRATDFAIEVDLMPLAHLLGQSGPSPSVVLTLPVDDIWSLDPESFLESFRASVTMLAAEADLQITEQDLDRTPVRILA